MKNENNKMDDLFDDRIGKSLRRMGYIFPYSADDFKRIEAKIEEDAIVQPERLKNPFDFIGERNFKKNLTALSKDDYSNSLAQAAREGREIPEDVKRKMAEDKLRSTKGKKG